MNHFPVFLIGGFTFEIFKGSPIFKPSMLNFDLEFDLVLKIFDWFGSWFPILDRAPYHLPEVFSHPITEFYWLIIVVSSYLLKNHWLFYHLCVDQFGFYFYFPANNFIEIGDEITENLFFPKFVWWNDCLGEKLPKWFFGFERN